MGGALCAILHMRILRKGTKEALNNKNRRKLTLFAIGIVVLLLIVVLVADGISGLRKGKTDTTKGLKIIKQAESADVTTIETKIQALEDKEKAESEDPRSLKEIFASTVVMGDSITAGFAEYDVLNASSVVAEIGVSLDGLDEQIKKVKELNPQVVFMSYGMNDILSTKGDTDLFVKKYRAVIDKVKEELPDTKIFINSIFPVQEKKAEEEPEYKNLEKYNEALREMCDKLQIAFVDNTALVSEEYYEGDGVHLKSDFYPVWARRMAELASL